MVLNVSTMMVKLKMFVMGIYLKHIPYSLVIHMPFSSCCIMMSKAGKHKLGKQLGEKNVNAINMNPCI